MNNIPFPFELREAEDKDLSFIYGSWLESTKNNSKPGSWLYLMPWARYRKIQTKIISNLLNQKMILIASIPDDKEHIIGYVVGSKIEGENVLHYVYVRPNRRTLGLAKEMISSFEDKFGKFSEYSLIPSNKELQSKVKLNYNPISLVCN